MAVSLEVAGFSCSLVEDVVLALEVNSEARLVAWQGDQSLLMDRFDARLLLDDVNEFKKLKSFSSDPPPELQAEEAQCDWERYRDLSSGANLNEDDQHDDGPTYPSIHDDNDNSGVGTENQASAVSEGNFTATPFTYGGSSAEIPPSKRQRVDEDGCDVDSGADSPFVVPDDLEVPDGMAVPQWQLTFARIEQTAKFVASQGAQMEVFLKAKQAANPKFLFMDLDHRLYPFYRLLVDAIRDNRYLPRAPQAVAKPPAPVSAPAPPPPATSSASMSSGGLVAYGDSDSEDDENGEQKQQEQQEQQNSQPHNSPPDAPAPPPNPAATSTFGYSGTALPRAAPAPVPATPPPSTVAISHPPPPAFRSSPAYYPPPTPRTATPSSASGPLPVIIPPPDIKEVADKTARYVARNGTAFEETLRQKKGNDNQFCFLRVTSPFHPYFRQQVVRIAAEL
eukprot:m.218663 g.218663  ORF g.218663 m.218663 type:complete len:451 (+) comp10788_c10_seq2:2128-3480(+)